MICVDFNKYLRYIRSFDQAVEIDKAKDKPLRFNVWKTTSDQVKEIFRTGSIDHLSQDEKDTSAHVRTKLENALQRIKESTASADTFQNEILNDQYNIEMSIALHEIMESVKGEADKARNNSIPIAHIANGGILPALPLSRVAASIGRKIAFQKGRRFKAVDKNTESAADIEELYYALGKRAIEDLANAGYLEVNEGIPTIKDYLTKKELSKDFVKVGVLTDSDSHVLSVKLKEDKLKLALPKKFDLDTDSLPEEIAYFLNRTESDLTDTELGVITDMLRVVRDVTQPSTIILPDFVTPNTRLKTADELAEADDSKSINPDPIIEAARKKLYDTPLYVHNSVHGLMQLLNAEAMKSGQSGTKIVRDALQNNDGLIKSLFGLKRSDEYSIDKKESVFGQNLSKTTPFDDLVENYGIWQNGATEAVALHLPLKIGRNGRLYYVNSVLNPHGSKQSRHMLTAGPYDVDADSKDFQYLVYGIKEALGDDSLTYADFTRSNGSKLDGALDIYAEYEAATTLDGKLKAISDISVIFPGVDYVQLLTTMQGIKDIRNPVDGVVTTQFTVSADATASGGTLTFLQALGTNPNVVSFLESVGLLQKEDGSVETTLDDLYAVMTNAIEDFVAGRPVPGLVGQSRDPNPTGVRLLLKDTVDLLFDNGTDTRSLSKDPTMTFVYGQGKKGATQTIARSLADRIIDNLEDTNVQTYLSKLMPDSEFSNLSTGELLQAPGLYNEIVTQLTKQKLPGQLYDLLDASINTQYLKEFKQQSEAVFKFVKKLPGNIPFKILPAGAFLAGKKVATDLKEFGMPITKLFEVNNPIEGSNDSVLTRMEKPQKTVMDVSTIHGMDAAQLYHSLEDVMGNLGAVVVHDDVRGSVQMVREMETKYAQKTAELVSGYDIHQQVMEAVAVYSPEIADTAEFKKLKAQIDANVAAKQELVNSRFNNETSALIGNGTKFEEFANTEGKPGPRPKPKKPKPKPKAAPARNDSPNMLKLLGKLAGESNIIVNFLGSVNRSAVIQGISNEFLPVSDEVSITGTDQGRGTGRVLDINNADDRKLQIELIEHEITHANTTAYLQKGLDPNSNDPVAQKDAKYFLKAVNDLRSYIANASISTFNGLDNETYARIINITDKPDAIAIAELVSTLTAETAPATDIYRILARHTPPKNLAKRIKEFVARIQTIILELTDKDFDKAVDVEKLYSAISRTIAQGTTDRDQNYEETRKYLTAFKDILGAGVGPDPGSAAQKVSLRYLNHAVSSMLNSKLERKGKSLLNTLDRNMRLRFPLYTDTADKLIGIYDSSDALQQLVHTITGNGTDKSKKADILAKFAEVSSHQNEVISQQMNEFHKVLQPLSAKERETVGKFVTRLPLHDYFVLADGITTAEDIAAEVTALETMLNKQDKQAVKDVDHLINWNVKEKQVQTGDIYNLSGYPDGEFGDNVRKLLALKSIQEIGAKDFEKFLENTELMSLVKDHVVANRLSVASNDGRSKLNDSLVPDAYKEPFHLKAIEKHELGRYEDGENTGWKVLKAPTDSELGIVYSPIIDSTQLLGAYTDIKLSSTDIDVTDEQARFSGVVSTTNGQKLLLTRQQKKDLGLIEDFSQGLVRGTAHNMAIQDSQVIRDALLQNETRMVIADKKPQDLIDIIDSDNVDNPWFLKLDGVTYNELDPKIKARYQKVGSRASNVNKFNEEVDLVRKDISHWLMGGSARSLFTNPKMKWATRIVKDLISGAKIGMVVLNPIKIANDNLSNLSYLGVMGVDPLFMAKNYRDITGDFAEYSELQRQIIQLKVKLTANPESDKIKKQVKTLQDRAKQNPVGDLATKGFINSLGSDLVVRNADTLSGMQADMHTALEYLLTNKKGNKNLLSHFIIQLQKIGPNAEDFLTYLGGIVGKTRSGKGFEKELDMVAERLQTIRSEEDVINYVSQFTTSPGSEAVRLGSAMTDLTDVLAKETLYRHLTQNEGMSAENARIRVLDSFPDYKENMPMAIKQLSDVGIIMFPSFWLRIQKVIYRMARDKPINLASEIMLQEALGSDVNTIVDANIINKSNTWGGLFHTPLEPIGVGSFLPTHMF